MKRYQANSILSISVTLEGGKSKHIIFDAMGNGKSIFTTSNRRVQEAIERNVHFLNGNITIVFDDTPNVTLKPKAQEIVVKEEAPLKQIKVSSWDDAKAYLTDELGIEPNKVKRQSEITKMAQAHNIEFIF